MPSDTAEHKAVMVQQSFPHPPPPQTQPLPCPRCGSTSTKFCYYNNYNLSQPRHFCKSCRRYWTQGGTLRNVPVGGGTRKSVTKHSRSTTSTSSSSSSSSSTVTSEAAPANPNSVFPEMVSHDVSLNDNVPVGGGYVGSFNFLLNTQGPGIMGPGGYGLGSMPGFDEMGFGLAGGGGGSWAFPEVGDFGGGSGNYGASVVASTGYNTWQMTGTDHEAGLNDGGDSFASPDLAISTPGQGLEK